MAENQKVGLLVVLGPDEDVVRIGPWNGKTVGSREKMDEMLRERDRDNNVREVTSAEV